MSYLYSVIEGITDLVYPRVCLACRKRRAGPDTRYALCPACEQAICYTAAPFCMCCGRTLEKPFLHKSHCRACRRSAHAFDRAFAPCSYAGVIRELLHEFKYKGKDYLASYLGGLMTGFIGDFGLDVSGLDCVVPVPLHASRLREREYNQAGLLARTIAERIGVALAPGILSRPRMRKTQALLTGGERRSNVTGCFAAAAGAALRNKRILLIDDVLTSGATASEAALVLKKAGAALVWVLTLAH